MTKIYDGLVLNSFPPKPGEIEPYDCATDALINTGWGVYSIYAYSADRFCSGAPFAYGSSGEYFRRFAAVVLCLPEITGHDRSSLPGLSLITDSSRSAIPL